MGSEKEVSNWLKAYPIKEYGVDLKKQQFWDGISIRYGWSLSNLPMTCAYSSKYDFQHNMSSKKGRLVSIGHNDIRDLTAKILREVCNDIKVEAKLIPLTGEQVQYRLEIIGDKSRLDIRVQSERSRSIFRYKNFQTKH